MFQASRTTSSTTAKHVFKRLYPWKSKEEFAKNIISNHLIFQQDGIIALNKPFGVGKQNMSELQDYKIQRLKLQAIELPSKSSIEQNQNQGSYHTRGVGSSNYTLEDIVPILQTYLGLPELQIVKTAEKYVSGVTLLSMDETSHENIRKALRRGKLAKDPPFSFYVITLNIPKVMDTCSGLNEKVGIGLAESSVTNEVSPIIKRNYSINEVKNRQVHPIRVQGKILDRNTNLNVSCLELKVTGVTHNFLRVFCADIAAPILGDHLYHGRVKTVGGVMVPLNPLNIRIGTEYQYIRKDVLNALNLKCPEDSLTIPLQVHLHSVNLPSYYSKKKSLVITAPLKENFAWTCQRLGLKIPQDKL